MRHWKCGSEVEQVSNISDWVLYPQSSYSKTRNYSQWQLLFFLFFTTSWLTIIWPALSKQQFVKRIGFHSIQIFRLWCFLGKNNHCFCFSAQDNVGSHFSLMSDTLDRQKKNLWEPYNKDKITFAVFPLTEICRIRSLMRKHFCVWFTVF